MNPCLKAQIFFKINDKSYLCWKLEGGDFLLPFLQYISLENPHVTEGMGVGGEGVSGQKPLPLYPGGIQSAAYSLCSLEKPTQIFWAWLFST